MGNFYLIIVDGLGVGAQEDAHLYGDEGMNTLGNVSEETQCKLPNLGKMGIGNIIPLSSVPEEENPTAAFGKMREVSAGKDSTTGHWEIAGIHLEKPFPTYPNGFPEDVIEKFCKGIGVEKALCNLPYSGTDVIRDYGEEHIKTGYPIVYTSADSVFQVACHEDVASVEMLYEWCEFARKEICVGEHEVGRVIARPFTGTYPYDRISDQRKDYSAIPPENNINEVLQANGIKTYSIGKVVDLFAGKGFSQYRKTKNNAEGISQLLSAMSAVKNSFVFVNLIDTDQLYGHRLDPEGFGKSLEEFDRAIPAILSKLKADDVLVITGDHGNDPCSNSTDHSREFVPLLVYPKSKTLHLTDNPSDGSMNLGTRGTFADVAVSVADFFEVKSSFPGKSFLK
ncbi:phosphopentomutase [Balneola sp. EhC07]|nr:phosphopentomutase [Balneola sp. EhC07]OAN64584.1 phosphopentomutase [Balneola sp. EhC07]